MDRDANTSVIFCHVYLTRQTAAAHQLIFQELERIVLEDTGSELRWRHLHASTIDETDGFILHWAADQHCGQAKGLGLHLQSLAQKLPVNRMDLHKPERPLRSLGLYEHLRQVYRLCVLPFIFPTLCWEKSFIPLPIWQAGEAHSNLIETVHRDINREGVHCTLLGGLIKGQQFDVQKMRTLETWETLGIRPTNQPTCNTVNAVKNLKRHDQLQQNKVRALAAHVAKHNEAMTKAHEQLERALQALHNRLPGLGDVRVGAAEIAATKALAKYREQRETGVELATRAQGVVQGADVGDEILG
ncbi:hypothetical protein DFH09DRAFT_1342455 [Mycena vulgaris]|nr:hypothetical protein DFH09DRAFT_1342455 [Mycena vulgaris]